jgi:hypothetical protein
VITNSVALELVHEVELLEMAVIHFLEALEQMAAAAAE